MKLKLLLPFLPFFIIVGLLVFFYFVNKKEFNKLKDSFTNLFDNKDNIQNSLSNVKNKYKDNIKVKRVSFSENKEKLFDSNDPPNIINIEEPYIDIEDNIEKFETWIDKNRDIMNNDLNPVPAINYPVNSNDLIKINNNIDTIDRNVNDIFEDMRGEIDNDVTDEQLKMIGGNEYNIKQKKPFESTTLYSSYAMPYFEEDRMNYKYKPYNGSSFGSMI